MSTRYDIKAWRKSASGKAYTVRIGSSWTDKNGVPQCELDALPLPDENGRVRFFFEPSRDRDAQPAAKREDYADVRGVAAPARREPTLNDDIPW